MAGLVPAIHAGTLRKCRKMRERSRVDARHKAGHDGAPTLDRLQKSQPPGSASLVLRDAAFAGSSG
ncbi:hypothetical protein D1O30_00315 [Methylocystis hirsuta]|uniref:Uncharacterized protein n=1 Tax=Methylocystis hirsuta TaxID=369798 RepID=A0A3M9XKI4_9HYPH|nr:hypothetical protein D1O30_00315 [Methylocystis hirsuta]